MSSAPTSVGGLPAHEIARRVKAELRTRMRSVRKALGEEARAEKSAAIDDRVAALSAWSEARTVMLFVPLRTEVDVRRLEARARRESKRVAAPRMIGDDGERGALEVRLWEPGVEPVESGRMGVREPPASAPLVAGAEVDLVVVPALALDPTGGRLGYGAGLYDRLLPHLSRATRVGVAFDFQLLSEVPSAEHDQRVHMVVTERRTIVV